MLDNKILSELFILQQYKKNSSLSVHRLLQTKNILLRFLKKIKTPV